jgi:hypothetical protein
MSPEITYNMLRSHVKSINQLRCILTEIMTILTTLLQQKLVIFTLFQACVTLSRLFYTFFSQKPTKKQ